MSVVGLTSDNVNILTSLISEILSNVWQDRYLSKDDRIFAETLTIINDHICSGIYQYLSYE
jgi:hypothetical protein